MTKAKKENVASLSEALGIAVEKFKFTHPRTSDTLEVLLIPGGLIEIAEYQEMLKAASEGDALAEIVRQFTSIVYDRRTNLSLTPNDIKTFFRQTRPEEIFTHMNMMLSGVVPDPK